MLIFLGLKKGRFEWIHWRMFSLPPKQNKIQNFHKVMAMAESKPYVTQAVILWAKIVV